MLRYSFLSVWLFLLAAVANADFCQRPLVYGDGDPGILYLYNNANHQVVGLDIEIPWQRQLVWLEDGRGDFLTGASKAGESERYAWFSSLCLPCAG